MSAIGSRGAVHRIAAVADAERLARRRIPRSVYQAFSGARSATVRDNLRAFAEVGFRPRAAAGHAPRQLATTILGRPVPFPVVVSPVGGLRLAHRDAEAGAAAAANAMGVPIGISTSSSDRIEDIVAAAPATAVWYQLYLAGGRGAAEAAIDRARSVGCTALVLTVDMLGVGVSAASTARTRVPTRITLRNAVQHGPEMAVRPRWFYGFARDGLRIDAGNVRTPNGDALAFSEALPINPTWDDIGWIADLWQGPIIVKGILRTDDARRAVDAGAAAIVVSNHGGFVLDGVSASLRALAGVVDTVGGEVEVLFDGGVRTGADVVKALAFGARAVLCGRACVWGLAAAGRAGVQRVLEILRGEIERTLAELGVDSVHDLRRDDLDLPAFWPARTGAL